MYDVKIEREGELLHLCITHNGGSHWSSVSFRSLGEMQTAINKMQDYIIYGSASKLSNRKWTRTG